MSGLVKRVLPGMAVAAVAIGSVVFFDRALQGETVAGIGGAGEIDSRQEPEAPAEPEAGAATGPDASQQLGCEAAERVSGPAADTPWGPVQVAAEVAPDGTLCEAAAVVYPMGDRRSSSINEYAIPVLDAAAATEGTAFDAVSGATYTSEAYRESLQALLDSL